VLPAGTGNDAARALGIPRRRAGALATLANAEVRTVDTLHLAQLDRHVLGSVPAGLDARIADRANRWPRALRIGAATYSLSALVEIALLPGRPPLRYRLTVDGVSQELEALVVVPANLSHYGGGLPIAPDADPADGLLDLVVIGPVGPAAAVGLLRAVRAGRHTEHPAVRITRARQVHLEGPADVIAQGDGEPLGPLPLTVTVAPAALRVLVPGLS
jgi:diacylglycerol kinase (ATP)